MCQNLNVIVRTTAAQSPWSKGLNESYNGIIGESVLKTMEAGWQKVLKVLQSKYEGPTHYSMIKYLE